MFGELRFGDQTFSCLDTCTPGHLCVEFEFASSLSHSARHFVQLDSGQTCFILFGHVWSPHSVWSCIVTKHFLFEQGFRSRAWVTLLIACTAGDKFPCIIILLEEPVFYLLTELQWHQWTKKDLSALILAIVDKKEKLAHTLAKAFYIFDPVSQCRGLFSLKCTQHCCIYALLKILSTSCQMTYWIKLYMGWFWFH